MQTAVKGASDPVLRSPGPSVPAGLCWDPAKGKCAGAVCRAEGRGRYLLLGGGGQTPWLVWTGCFPGDPVVPSLTLLFAVTSPEHQMDVVGSGVSWEGQGARGSSCEKSGRPRRRPGQDAGRAGVWQ